MSEIKMDLLVRHIRKKYACRKGDYNMTNTHNIIHAGTHYEALDEYGNFVCSGDTWNECYDELVDILISEARAELHMENIRKAVTA